MRKLLLLLLATYFVFTSCSKYKDDSERRKFVSMMLDSGFEIGEDPKAVVTYADASADNPVGFPTLLVSGFSTHSKLFYTFSITSTDSLLRPGNYTSSMSGNSITLLDSSAHILSADVDQGAFSLHILSVKDSTVQGEFTATLINQSTGQQHIIERGAFRTNFSRQ